MEGVQPALVLGMSHFNESVTLVVIYLDHTPPAWTYHDRALMTGEINSDGIQEAMPLSQLFEVLFDSSVVVKYPIF